MGDNDKEQKMATQTTETASEISQKVDYLVRLADEREARFERARVEGVVLTNAVYEYLASLGKAPGCYSAAERALNEARNRFLQHDAGNFNA